MREEVYGDSQTEEERSRRLEDIAERILQKAKSIHTDFKMFFERRDETAHRFFPDAETLEALDARDREQLLRLIGRMAGAMGTVYVWSKPFVRECALVLESAVEREKVEKIIERLYDLSAFHLGSEMNTNSMGGSRSYQEKLDAELAKALNERGDDAAVRALLDPYDLARGGNYYLHRRDKNGVSTMEEKPIGEVSIDGVEALIDDEGETRTIAEFNFKLNINRGILRDGSNYFGGIENSTEYPKELKGIRAGDEIEVRSPNPLFGEMVSRCIFLGTNEDELLARYGKAYMAYGRQLIKVRYKYIEEGKERTGEFPCDSCTIRRVERAP